jgi:hypothetical protein
MKKTQQECLEMARLAPKLDYEKLYFDEIEKLEEKKRSPWKKVPPRLYSLFYSILKKEKSLTKRIKAKCLDCSSYQKDEITNCNIEFCPLYQVRPYQRGEK